MKRLTLLIIGYIIFGAPLATLIILAIMFLPWQLWLIVSIVILMVSGAALIEDNL